MSEALIAAVINAICLVESSGSHKAINFNDGGSPSYGLCQVKLSTARMMGFQGYASELWLNKETNKLYARKYLEWQLRRYGCLTKAIAAYNMGSYKETDSGLPRNARYVGKVLTHLPLPLRKL